MNRSIARLFDFLKRHYIDILAFVGIYVLVLTVIHFANRETVSETIENGDFISYLSYDETVNGSYTGYMLNNEYVLKGEFVFLTGESYSGEWNSSVISGEGTLSYPGIGKYVGSFSDGKRNGNGKFTWENGDVYSGEWEDDVMSGEGSYAFKNGDLLSGTFSNNTIADGKYIINGKNYRCVCTITDSKVNKKVNITFTTGDSYYGTVKSGKLHGSGEFTYADGSSYSGSFKSNKRNGTGTYTWADGAHYVGNWSDDKMNGKGVYYYSSENTPRLEGKFSKGKPVDTCIYYETEEVKYQTKWKKGKCVRVVEL